MCKCTLTITTMFLLPSERATNPALKLLSDFTLNTHRVPMPFFIYSNIEARSYSIAASLALMLPVQIPLIFNCSLEYSEFITSGNVVGILIFIGVGRRKNGPTVYRATSGRLA